MLTPFVIESYPHYDKSDGAYLGGVFRATFFLSRILLVLGHKVSLNIVMGVSLNWVSAAG